MKIIEQTLENCYGMIFLIDFITVNELAEAGMSQNQWFEERIIFQFTWEYKAGFLMN